MSTFNVKENVGSVQTAEEFDALLVRYAKQDPEKFAAKTASGEFAAFRKTLIGGEEVVVTPEVPADPAPKKKKSADPVSTEEAVK